MAAGEREDQVPDAAGTLATDASGRAAPAAQRKQQGPLRQFFGSFGKDVDAERLAQLRKDNLEYRLEREKNEERRQKKKEQMAEVYKKHKAEAAAKAKEERRTQLARLEAQSQRRAERALAQSEKEEVVDEEYRLLLEKYGHRVKMPNVPHEPWKQERSVTMDSGRSRSGEASPRKPHIPRVKPCCGAPSKGAAKAAGSADAGASSASASAAATGTVGMQKATKGSTTEGNPTSQVVAGIMAARRASRAEGIALPPLTSPTGAGGAASGRRGSVQRDVAKVVKEVAPARTAEPLSGDSITSEVPEPERSVMPRKDGLRKFQQALLKKTDVSFYKSHMKKHLRRILEATELTYSDTNGRREQASWNLAKPLTVGELKLLSSVVVRT